MPDVATSSQKDDAAMFLSEVGTRGITQLVHFTPSINLLSIFSVGFILSRAQLEKLSIASPEMRIDDFVEINDQLRLDNRRDYINLSVQCPNTWLLQRFRTRPHFSDNWCVLTVSPHCIALKDTLFSVSNAASSASRGYGIAGDIDGFRRMFADRLTVGSAMNPRVVARNGLRPCHTTDVQAEVLVHQKIPVTMILRAVFESELAAKQTLQALRMSGLSPSCPFLCDTALFSANRS